MYIVHGQGDSTHATRVSFLAGLVTRMSVYSGLGVAASIREARKAQPEPDDDDAMRALPMREEALLATLRASMGAGRKPSCGVQKASGTGQEASKKRRAAVGTAETISAAAGGTLSGDGMPEGGGTAAAKKTYTSKAERRKAKKLTLAASLSVGRVQTVMVVPDVADEFSSGHKKKGSQPNHTRVSSAMGSNEAVRQAAAPPGTTAEADGGARKGGKKRHVSQLDQPFSKEPRVLDDSAPRAKKQKKTRSGHQKGAEEAGTEDTAAPIDTSVSEAAMGEPAAFAQEQSGGAYTRGLVLALQQPATVPSDSRHATLPHDPSA